MPVSTEEYGTMWLAFSHDTKQNLTLISDGHESLSATLNVLKKKLQLHVVEIIGEQTFIELLGFYQHYRVYDVMLDVRNNQRWINVILCNA